MNIDLYSNSMSFSFFDSPSRCGHCKSLAPAYAAAAKQLAVANSEIKLASVDATIEQDLATRFQVRGYPTIKFFVDGAALEYNGGRSQDDIVNWLKKKTGPPAEDLKTVADLNKFKADPEVAVIGVFADTDGAAAAAYLQVAKTFDGVPFAISSNADVIKELGVSGDAVVLFKKVRFLIAIPVDSFTNDIRFFLTESLVR